MTSKAKNLQMNEVYMPWESVMTVDVGPWRCLMLWWLMEQLLVSRKLQILLQEFPPCNQGSPQTYFHLQLFS